MAGGVIAAILVLAALWGGLYAWPRSQGYYSIADLIRDWSDKSYTRSFDRSGLRADLVAAGFRMGDAVFIRIFKQENRLELWLSHDGAYRLFRSYPICRFSGKLGPKLAEGDHQAPEGFYQIARSQMNPKSRRYLAFNLGFPNIFDRNNGRTGSYLMVHGGCSSVGCYAMTDEKVDEIYALMEAAFRRGQGEVPVHIFPFELTDEALAAHGDSEWADFWANLKTGYDLFEQTGVPPVVGACGTTYVFNEETQRADCQLVTGWG